MKRIILLIAILALAGCASAPPELTRFDQACSASYVMYSAPWRNCRLALYQAELSRSSVTQSTTVIQER